jgi:hypothetical protein
LPYIEGRVEGDKVRLTAFADGPHPSSFESIGIVIEKPEEYQGRVAVFIFDSREDSDYKMLLANTRGLIRVSAKDGRGYWSQGEIHFASKNRPQFTKEEPNPERSVSP